MYAIIRTGGKQYTVRPGDVLQVSKMEHDLGAEITLSEVLLIGGDTAEIGAPLVKGASVAAVVTKQARTRKIDVFKKRRRHSYRKWNTHRQDFTELFIKGITFGGKTAKAEGEANVKDMDAIRLQRIVAKQEVAQARRENRGGDEAEEAPAKKAAAKKKTAKKAGPKKAGKSKSGKKAGAKKAAKKTTKK